MTFPGLENDIWKFLNFSSFSMTVGSLHIDVTLLSFCQTPLCSHTYDFISSHLHPLTSHRCVAPFCLGDVCKFQTRRLRVMRARIAVLCTCQASHASGISEGTQTVSLASFWSRAGRLTVSPPRSPSPRCKVQIIRCQFTGCYPCVEVAEGRSHTAWHARPVNASDELLWLHDDRLPSHRDQLRPPHSTQAHTPGCSLQFYSN